MCPAALPSSLSSVSGRGAIDLGLGHVLAGPRIISQQAGLPVQVELARRVQGLADIFHVIARRGAPADGKLAAVGEPHDLVGDIHRSNAVPGGGPGVIHDHDRIVEIRPRLDVLIVVTQTVAGNHVILHATVQRLDNLGRELGAFVGGPRGRATFAVDKQRAEIPPPLLHARNHGRPQGAFRLLPAGDRHAAAEDRLLAGIGGIGNRGLFRARVSFEKRNRLAHGIGPAAEQHADRLAKRCPILQTTNGVAGAGQGGQGAITAVGFGGVQAGPTRCLFRRARRRSRPWPGRQPRWSSSVLVR